MKKLFLLLLLFVSFIFTSYTQTMKSFRLEGTILNTDTLSEVNILIFADNTLKTTKAKVVNNKFVFEGGLKHPCIAIIKGNNIRQEFGVWLVNDTIQADFEVKKREPSSLYLHTKNVRGNQESIDFNEHIYKRNGIQTLNITKNKRKNIVYKTLEQYVMNHKDSYSSLSRIYSEIEFGGCDLANLEDLFESLSEEVRSSDNGTYFKEKVAKFRKNAVGNRIPDAKTQNIEGDSVMLSSLIKGKTIIDFWASWCAPCRAKHKEIVKYKKLFEDKSVKIIGISLDDDKQKWLNAIKTDNINWWTNLADLNGGFDSNIAQLFKIKSVPFTILVDEKMNIQAIDYPSIMYYITNKKAK